MILSKISLILTVIVVILLDFVQSMLEMQWNSGIILYGGADRYVLGYAPATNSIDRYIHLVYLCMVQSMRAGRTEYLKRVRELERQDTHSVLLDHLCSYHFVYVLVGIYLFVGIITLFR